MTNSKVQKFLGHTNIRVALLAMGGHEADRQGGGVQAREAREVLCGRRQSKGRRSYALRDGLRIPGGDPDSDGAYLQLGPLLAAVRPDEIRGRFFKTPVFPMGELL